MSPPDPTTLSEHDQLANVRQYIRATRDALASRPGVTFGDVPPPTPPAPGDCVIGPEKLLSPARDIGEELCRATLYGVFLGEVWICITSAADPQLCCEQAYQRYCDALANCGPA